jgi:hypothetical protein
MSSYRSISLLTGFSEELEKVMLKRIISFVCQYSPYKKVFEMSSEPSNILYDENFWEILQD